MLPGSKTMRRFINNFDELTSRLRSSDIPAILQKLFNPKGKDVVDLCYATNMIQVGLDVPRLSLMSSSASQRARPSTSRPPAASAVADGTPGLVVTNYNPFKPRDRSHFESFRSFHENAYRFVEATSVTPFSHPRLRTGHPRTCGFASRVSGIRNCAEHPLEASPPARRKSFKHDRRADKDRGADEWTRATAISIAS